MCLTLKVAYTCTCILGGGFILDCLDDKYCYCCILMMGLTFSPRSAAWKSFDFDMDIVRTLIDGGSLLLICMATSEDSPPP